MYNQNKNSYNNHFGDFNSQPNRNLTSNNNSVNNSPNLRNQFLSNANPSSDNLSTIHNLQNHPNDFVNYGNDDFDFSDNINNNNNRGYVSSNLNYLPLANSSSTNTNIAKKVDTNTNVNEYELSSMRKVSDAPLMNPFDPNYDYNNNNHNNVTNDYANYDDIGLRPSNSPSNPFNHPAIVDTRYDPTRNAPLPPLTDAELDQEKSRKNQKNRLKQIRRHPRFHYTNLPYFTMLVTLIQVIVFIVELVKMSQLTGSAFQTKPYFNPMLGPSTYLLINMGARYAPCMNPIKSITNDTSINFPCPNSTNTDTNVCSLNELCGLSGISSSNGEYKPDQWYRIFIPIFLHAGFLHIIFNLLLQVTMGATIERNIGIIKYAIIYIASGIGGFLLGANFSPDGIASTGASGSLFGIMATNMIMFVFSGRKNSNLYGTKHYGLFILIMVSEIVISLVLGLLPGLDNFSHIGGFAVGVLTAIILLPDPFFIYADGIITYNARDNTLQQFKNNWNPKHNWSVKVPSRFFIWLAIRLVSLVLTIVFFVMLAKNFFDSKSYSGSDSCKWCKYINCIPVHGWCDIGEVSVETTDDDSSASTSASSSPSSTSSTSTDSSLPDNIDNTGNNKRRRRQYYQSDALQLPHVPYERFEPYVSQKQIASNNLFIHDQNSGITLGLCFFIAFLTFRFFKHKK